jgi:diguanylate cyclase (GGDEF)-like protein
MPPLQSHAGSRQAFSRYVAVAAATARAEGRGQVVYVASFLGLAALWQREGAEAVGDVMTVLHDVLLAEAPPGAVIEQLGELEIGASFPGDAEDARALRRRINDRLPVAFDLGPEQLLQAAAWTVAPDDRVADDDLLWDTSIRAVRARSSIGHAAMEATLGRDHQLDAVVGRVLEHSLAAYGVAAAAIEVGDRTWALPARPDRPPDAAWSLWTGARSVGRIFWWGMDRPSHRTALEEGLTSVALAVERAVALEATELRARQDSLTGLLNRDGLARAMDGVSRPCAVGIVDIDHFKSINDRYGHRIGDRMLIALADLLRLGGRSIDVVARWGGEELVVVMPGTSPEGAAAALRRYLADAQATIAVGDAGLSFSAGVVELAEEGVEAFEAAVHAADIAMYEAKRAGRGRVVVGAT